MLTLPANLDPCDFLLKEGADAFRALVERAVDPLAFALDRAGGAVRPRLDRGRAAGGRVGPGDPGRRPESDQPGRARRQGGQGARHAGSQRLGVPRRDARAPAPRALASGIDGRSGAAGRPRPRPRPRADPPADRSDPAVPPTASPIRPADLDPIDRELVQIVLNEPSVGRPPDLPGRRRLDSGRPAAGDPSGLLRPARRRAGATLRSDVMLRLDDPRSGPWRPACSCRSTRTPCPRTCVPPPGKIACRGVLATLAERERQDRLRDLDGPWPKPTRTDNPDAYRALRLEYSTSHDPAAGHEEKDAS